MRERDWMDWFQVVVSVGAIIALAISFVQLGQAARDYERARQEALRAEIAEFGNLAVQCDRPERPTSKWEPAGLWTELCGARRLAYEIMVYDMMRLTGGPKPSLLETVVPEYASIHLEDALVRELVAVAEATVVRKRQKRMTGVDDPCRARGLLLATYMMAHAWPKENQSSKCMSRQYEDQVKKHRDAVAREEDLAHARRFLRFAKLLDALATDCPDPTCGELLAPSEK